MTVTVVNLVPGMRMVLRGRTSTPWVGNCRGLLASATISRSAGVWYLEQMGQRDPQGSGEGNSQQWESLLFAQPVHVGGWLYVHVSYSVKLLILYFP